MDLHDPVHIYLREQPFVALLTAVLAAYREVRARGAADYAEKGRPWQVVESLTQYLVWTNVDDGVGVCDLVTRVTTVERAHPILKPLHKGWVNLIRPHNIEAGLDEAYIEKACTCEERENRDSQHAIATLI